MADDPKAPSMLGAYIRTQRQLADLSLRQLATLSNVSNAYLSQVERGLHQPSLKVIRGIADALDISTENLLTKAGVMNAAVEASAEAVAQVGETAGSAMTTIDAIAADEFLAPEEKQALLALYRTFVARSAGVSEANGA